MEILRTLAPGLFLLAAIVMAAVGVRSQQGKKTPTRITAYAVVIAILGLIGIFGPIG
jgi:uncharacterized membrane protein